MKTKLDKVRDHLNKGFSINGRDAYIVWGYYRLSDGIHKLRKEGMKIETISCVKNGNQFAKYKLEKVQ